MKNRFYRFLSLILAFLMLASSMPTVSYAVEINDNLTDNQIETEEETLDNENIIEEDSVLEEATNEEELAVDESESKAESEDIIEDSEEDALLEDSSNSTISIFGTEEIDETELTDLDIELMNQGATIPDLEPIATVDYVPESLYQNSGYARVFSENVETVYNPLETESYLPQTRNQNPYGTCWAHASIACNEINAIKNGQATRDLNLSESHLVTALIESPVDPLGLSNDESRYIGEKTKLSNVLDGGNVHFAVEPFLCWQGLAEDEGEFSYSNIRSRAATALSTEEAYGNTIYTTQGVAIVNLTNRDDAKKAIKEYGALATNFYAASSINSEYYSGKNNLASYYCYDSGMGVNHAITIVGWDDGYSRDNFNHTPSGDGAWLIRNSWSITDSKEYSYYTYFWMSYYDKSLESSAYAFKCEVAGQYDNNYFYDRTVESSYLKESSGINASNIFEAKACDSGEYIKAVGFETKNTNVNYTVQVYKNLTDYTDPNSGTLAAEKSGKTTFEGYTTVKLDDPVLVSKGDKFSVIVNYSLDNSNLIMVPIDGSFRYPDWLETVPEASSGESYYRSNSETTWKSMTSGNFRIKAYTSNALDTPTHSITYNVDSKLLDSNFKTSYHESEYYLIPSINKEGYAFAGWYKSSDLSDSSRIKNTKNENTDLNLYAKWIPNKYTVSYRANNGVTPESYYNEYSQQTCGVPFTLRLNSFTKKGYLFDGWNTKADGTGESYTDGGSCDLYVSNNTRVNLYAQWREKDPRTVSFDANGGTSVLETVTVKVGEQYPTLPTTTRTGYTFVGWFTSENVRIKAGDYCDIDENHVLTAHWTPNKYKVNLVADGGQCDSYIYVEYDSYLFPSLPTPVKSKYEFEGWYTASVGGDKITETRKVDFTYPITLYARYNLKYTVSAPYFNDEGTEYGVDSDNNTSKIVKKGSVVDILCDIQGAKLYYTLDGSNPTPDNLSADSNGTHLFVEPILINPDKAKSVLIKVIAVKEDYNSSVIVSERYMSEDLSGNWGEIDASDKAEFIANGLDADDVPENLWVKGIEDKDYTGKAVTQSDFRVYSGKTLLTPNVDYTVRYSNNTKASTETSKATITIAGKGNYTGTIVKEFNVKALDISAATADNLLLAFNGKVQKAKPEVNYLINGTNTKLKEKTDYTLEYIDGSSNAYFEEGTYTIRIKGNGNYKGYKDVTETITKKGLISKATVKKIPAQKYDDGNTITPEITVTMGKTTLVKNVDYSVEYRNHTDIGNGIITITGKGDYTGTKIVTFSIVGTALSSVKFDPELTKPKQWTGKKHTPVNPNNSLYIMNGKEKVYLNGISKTGYNDYKESADPIIKSFDYTFEYVGDLTKIGTVTIIFTGINGYSGTVKKTFNITGTAASSLGVDFANKVTSFQYNGNPIEPASMQGFKVYKKATKTSPAEELTMSTDNGVTGDYTVSYDKNTNAGTASLIITGINGYTGSVKKTFKITPYDATLAGAGSLFKIDDISNVAYSKGGAKPNPVVRFNGGAKPLVLGQDYTVSYANNTKAGIANAVVKVTGKGNYKGIVTDTFSVERKSLTSPKLKFTVGDIVCQNKAGICKPAITIMDETNQALAAGTDYDKNMVFTYKYDTTVSQNDKTLGLHKVNRSEGDYVDPKNDIIPKDTVINVKITGINNYEGEKTVSFRFVEADISKASIKINNQQYTGNPVILSKDDITVKVGKVTLGKEDFRIVSYSNNTQKGKAQVTIEGIGNYGGTKSANFTITTQNMNYNVVYNKNGDGVTGSMANSLTAANAKVTKCSYKRPGYVFKGWSLSSDGSVIIKDGGALKIDGLEIYGSTIELYAVWE